MKTIYYILVGLVFFLSCKNEEKGDGIQMGGSKNINWEYADTIKQKIEDPIIPLDTFKLSDMVLTNGPFRIQQAIDLIAKKGGGTLIIPKGMYYSGAIEIKSKIELYLEEGTHIQFIPDTNLYPLKYTWFSGKPCMNYSSFIYARNASNIKISGKGIIDGQGNDNVWKNMKFSEHIDWNILIQQLDNGVSIEQRKFGNGHSLRPDLIGFYNCSKVSISGVSIVNGPYVVIHPVLSKHISITECKIKSNAYDQVGIGVESSQYVLIDNVQIDHVNEGIKFLSGGAEIDNNQSSSEIIVQNCSFNNIVHSPIVFSSTSYGGLNRIFISNIKFNTSEIGISFYGKDHVNTHHIFIKNIRATDIKGTFLYNTIADSVENSIILSNIYFEDIQVVKGSRAFVLLGGPTSPIQNIIISNSKFDVSKGSYLKHVKGLQLINCEISEKIINATFTEGENKIPKIYLKSPEGEVLDSDDIQYHRLPEIIKSILNRDYNHVPVNDIDRIKTSSNTIYKIRLEVAPMQDVGIVVQEDGSLISSKFKIDYHTLPIEVITTIENYLGSKPVSYIFNEINQISYKDFAYYEIIGEYDEKLFALGISADGKIIEEKQQNISNFFKIK